MGPLPNLSAKVSKASVNSSETCKWKRGKSPIFLNEHRIYGKKLISLDSYAGCIVTFLNAGSKFSSRRATTGFKRSTSSPALDYKISISFFAKTNNFMSFRNNEKS